MATCDVCGEYENLPYQCKRCGQTFCAEHRLPENHDCPGLAEWDDPGGVFDSGFDESVEGGSTGGTGGRAGGASAGVVGRFKRRVDRASGTGGIMGYFRNNATYAILLAIWVTFVAQWVALFVGGEALHDQLFVLQPDALANVWTWVTSVFSHAPGVLFHIVGNSIVILFFGPLVERAVGSKRFVAFFVLSGMIAGLGHVLFGIATGAPPVGVLGASGAGFAILGVLTVWRPNMQVLLFFVIPMKIKYLTWGIALVSAVLVVQSLQAGGGGSAGNIAHLAHLIGFAIGLAFGKRNEGLARSTGGAGGVSMGGARGPRGPGGPGGPGGRF
ncbi:membrane associated rhomboid family serine protease [Halorubrum trapanicum]|uniref:Membrane associated rhomboid family serine protease n=1 Tax=Halorubrum trapanicum TaxID=29284 RepID=A0A8J7UNP4_9EURY|nr:rhomboid family intramembrane serine protease [Halorubrum trapanicum]MBP1902071.1 membrane associated rhomboid family serine protease [Halorubrum trapanicum]